jgi:2-hydroxy-6-oxonona-2,4-dienedioate hydrolase
VVATTQLTEESTSRIVQTKEWKLHFYEAGTGHPIIMLHGTGPGATGWSNFRPNLIPLSEKYRVIALNFPGWGKSDPFDPSAEPRGPANARAVKLLMDELGIERAALVGNSMGGGATIQFTVDYPDRISHFITMGSGVPGANFFSPGGLSEGIRIIRETYMDPSPQNFKRLVTIMVYDPSFVTDELCELRSRSALASPTHLQNWLKPPKMAPPTDTLSTLATREVPALIIHGRDDRVVPPEGSLRLFTALPNSRLHMFNHCGHWAQIEHADEFNWLVDNFISHNM